MLSHPTEAIITQFSNVLFCYAIFILIIDEIFCIPPLRIRNVYVMFIELWQWGKQATNTYTVITSTYSSSLFLIFFGISTSFKEELLFVFFFFFGLVDLTGFYVKKKCLRNTWYAMELFYSHGEDLSWSLVQGYVVLKPRLYFFLGIAAQTSEENTHREASMAAMAALSGCLCNATAISLSLFYQLKPSSWIDILNSL